MPVYVKSIHFIHFYYFATKNVEIFIFDLESLCLIFNFLVELNPTAGTESCCRCTGHASVKKWQIYLLQQRLLSFCFEPTKPTRGL